MPDALRIALVGAESTGKSALTQSLAQRLADDFGFSCASVTEFLREWCDAEGRTPRPDEQMGIAREQQRRIDAAAASGADVVLCDTTPLMIAVYSELLFADRSLVPFARRAHERVDLTLLTALDLPWVADGLMRDGPHVRAPVDALVREHLLDWGGPFAIVSGAGARRTDVALDALRPLLGPRLPPGRRSGLFSALLAGPAQHPGLACECCPPPGLFHVPPTSGTPRPIEGGSGD